MRTKRIFTITSAKKLKDQLLQWAQQFDEVVWLDSNNHEQMYGNYDAILAVEAFTLLKSDFVNVLIN